jgi:WD40 repeat protein
MNCKKIKEIKNYHNEYITFFNHYLDKEKKRDLIMSISEEDNNIRIWNINNWECILNINKINRDGILRSGCFLIYNYEICILSCSSEYEPIKVFNLNGKQIKEINNSDEPTYFIDTYFDNLLSKKFIITGNDGYVKSYIINENKVYYKYNDNESMFTSYAHYNIIVKKFGNIIKLIESCDDGNIRIWKFHAGILLKKIKVSNEGLRGICLYNDNYLFIGCKDKSIKLLNLDNELIIYTRKSHQNEVISLKKIFHPFINNQNILLSQNYKESKIYIWVIQEENI